MVVSIYKTCEEFIIAGSFGIIGGNSSSTFKYTTSIITMRERDKYRERERERERVGERERGNIKDVFYVIY